MKADIYSNNNLIGTAELELIDENRGVVSGIFTPMDNYREIRKTIWAFHNPKSTVSNADLNKLRLNARLENGWFLFPLGGFLITDFEELSNKEITFEAAGVYPHVVEDYFQAIPPKNSRIDPWEFITIEQKIAFEEELKKEIGVGAKRSFFQIGKQRKHKLSEFKFSAQAISNRSDDVVFAVNGKEDSPYKYAIIHLTWKGKLEKNDLFPAATFFENFEELLKY